MLVIHPSSSCDICLETYFEIDAYGQKRIPHATECGHVFCKQCIDSLPRLLCPLCRAYLDPRAIRRLHVETTPATTPSALSYPIKSEGDPDEKESLKARLIAMVREGADGTRFQALLHEACTWLRDRSHDDEHWDLRALYLLVVRYQQMHKDQQGAQLSLYKATNEFQETHRRYQRREQDAEREIARLHSDVQAERAHTSALERKADELDARWSRKYENVMDEVRALREQIESFSRRAGPDRYADPGARPHGGPQPSLLSMSKPREPSSDENESSDDDNGLLKPPTTTPVEGGMDHFSPLPAHLSPAPAPMNAFSPLYEHLASEYPDSKDPPPPPPQPSAQSSRRSKPASPDGSIEKADYVSASTTKPMAISGVNAVAARFYDLLGESSASGSSSLPHPHPATYYSKRQEKQREHASLSRNNSSSAGSGSPGSRGMSSKMRQRVNRLQLQLVPDSSDEGEVNARHERMYKLTDILTTPLPAARALGAPGEDNEGGGASRRAQGEAPAPPPAPPPPPPHWQCTTVSHASAAAQALERERERRRKESGGSYASTRSTPPQEPPVTAPATFASSTASERPRAFMERRDSSASTRSGYEGKSRRLEA